VPLIEDAEGCPMTFSEAIQSGFQKYVTFGGRATRSEYWYWILFGILIGIVAGIVDGILRTHGAIRTLVSLGLLLPGLAVGVRRLHDIGRSGWWLLILYAPTAIGAVFVAFAAIAIGVAFFGARAGTGVGAAGLLSGLVGLLFFLGGFIFWIYTMTRPSDPQANMYGPAPGLSV
jgi:uncharacterized membrane protein YhaH (DUF805 family)